MKERLDGNFNTPFLCCVYLGIQIPHVLIVSISICYSVYRLWCIFKFFNLKN